MNMKDIIKRFEALKGLEIKDDGRVFVIKDVSMSGIKVVLSTDWKTFVMHESEARRFLEEIKVVGVVARSESVTVKDKEVVSEFIQNSDKVTGVLLEMMDKIGSEDSLPPDLLNKAKSVCQIANTLVGLERVKQGYLVLSKR